MYRMLDNNTYLNRYSINRRNLTLSLFTMYVRTLQEGGASNEVIDDVDGNGNGTEVLSDWIIDELELFDYYYCNEDRYSTTSTTANSIATEREEAMTEYTWFSF